MMSLVAAALFGATAVASVLAVAPLVRQRRFRADAAGALLVPQTGSHAPATPAAGDLHAQLLAELLRPVAAPVGCRGRRARRQRPLSH